MKKFFTIYRIRCTSDTDQIALTFRGALAALRHAGADAAVFTLSGEWVAGRRFQVSA